MGLSFTDRQLDLMNILWDEGSATVRETKEALDEELAYTSVLTVFQTLEKNGHVRHEPEGKAYRYYPTVSREEAGREAVSYLKRRIFQGSATALTETLMEQTEETLLEAEEEAEEAEEEKLGLEV